jgi:hypothetical protein
MNVDDELAGALKAMLMPARWNGLRRSETNRVIGGLIYPKIFKFAPKWYLVKIVQLLNSNIDLGSLLSDRHPSETDQEIRYFLSDLAVEIEKTFPTVARSGQRVRTSGYWAGENSKEHLLYLNEGDIFPHTDSNITVWEKKNDAAGSPEQVLLREFSTYYTRRTIGERLLYKQPLEFAMNSVCRLIDKDSNPFKKNVEDLLLAMSEDRLHPLTKKIEGITKQDWTEDDENWEWYKGLLSAMHDEMAKPKV